MSGAWISTPVRFADRGLEAPLIERIFSGADDSSFIFNLLGWNHYEGKL